MRTISLVNRLKWAFSGNMNPHALVLGDVDNDGDTEFVIGNLNGDLAIFKGECQQGLPTYICRGLGTITCIAVGDVRNCGKNSITVINAEGDAHIFDIPAPAEQHVSAHQASAGSYAQHQMPAEEYLKQGRRTSDTASIQALRKMMSGGSSVHAEERPSADNRSQYSNIHNLQRPNFTLKVPVNVNKILIADIDGDSLNEIILARTDRILHAFQLVLSDIPPAELQPRPSGTPLGSTPSSTSSSSPAQAQQPSSPSLSAIKDRPKTVAPTESRDMKSQVLRKGMGLSKPGKPKDSKDGEGVKVCKADERAYIIEKDMWVFDGQITSLTATVHPDKPQEPILLVAQPGNTFTIIDREGNRFNRDFTPQYSSRAHQNRRQTRQSSPPLSASFGNSDKPAVLDTTILKEHNEGPMMRGDEEESLEDTLPEDVRGEAGPLSNLGKATRTIRTMLQRSSSRIAMSTELETDNIIISKDDEGSGNIRDITGNEIQRSNYVVQNWSMLDGDDIIGDEKSGAVATEIVIGKRHSNMAPLDPSRENEALGRSEVGMLSMDGKFTIHDLRNNTSTQRDLFVTHKLFSLATLDVSRSATLPKKTQPGSGTRKDSLNSPHIRLSSPCTRSDSPLSNDEFHVDHSNHESPCMSPLSKLSNVVSHNAEKGDLKERHQLATTGDIDILQPPVSPGEETRSLETPSDPASGPDTTTSSLKRGSISSTRSAGGSSWSDGNENEDAPDCDLFVACAWNGVTYLIDWSKQMDDPAEPSSPRSTIKFQLVKFAFEGRVCAFTAGLYAVSPGYNVPCLFYVDFEDQIFVYYDVRISPGPVTGLTDAIDDDIEEAVERIMDLETSIQALHPPPDNSQGLTEGVKTGVEHFLEKMNHSDRARLNLAEFIHDCLSEFEDMKEYLERQVAGYEQRRLSRHLPSNVDVRRLSDLNITIEPPLDRADGSDTMANYNISSPHTSDSSDDELQAWMNDRIARNAMGPI